MLEAETSSSSKNPKHHWGEESISDAEDTETLDLQDDRSPSPPHDAYENPIFPPEDIDAPGQSEGEGEMSEEDTAAFKFIEDYPGEAGTPVPGRRKKTPFEKLKRVQQDRNQEPWSPFANEEEWELARWLMSAGVSQAKVDEFLKLPIVSAIIQVNLHYLCGSQKTQKRTKPSYHNKRALLEKIDALPDVPGWTCEVFEITGDQVDIRDASGKRKLTEEVELWRRDPVECIRELIGNPAFRKHMRFEPERVFTDAQCKNVKFDNMWTCEWWWNLQVRMMKPLPKP